MDVHTVKPLTLDEIKKVIDALGNVAESTLNPHSLALIISKSGETTFTSCGWKILNEVVCSCPLSKFICNAAKNYTLSCGEDCKHFLFILKEIFSFIYHRVNKNNEIYTRKAVIKEICSLKYILPCVFKNIQYMTEGCVHSSNSISFNENLQSIVLTFMLSRFSVSISKVLSSLICDFIQNVCDIYVLKTVLEYVISHFDIICCKIFSPLSESKILKGVLLSINHIECNVNLENTNFIIVWNLTRKEVAEDITLKIKDESFVANLNPVQEYKTFFHPLKSHDIKLVFSPSTCDKSLKSLCKKENIFLFDRLEKMEIEYLLFCFQICPVDNLNESLESKHIGIASYVKLLSFNKSHFLHIVCKNSTRYLNSHHILLSAPCNSMWMEYYSEILNCFKLLLVWLNPDTNVCYKNITYEIAEGIESKVLQLGKVEEIKQCDLCSKIKLKLEKNELKKAVYLSDMEVSRNKGMLLAPCSWELMFKTILEKVIEDSIPCNVVIQATHQAIMKSICKRIGFSFAAVKSFENVCDDFIKRCNLGEIRFLEPTVSKEIMILNIVDLLLQLFKIDNIVFTK